MRRDSRLSFSKHTKSLAVDPRSLLGQLLAMLSFTFQRELYQSAKFSIVNKVRDIAHAKYKPRREENNGEI